MKRTKKRCDFSGWTKEALEELKVKGREKKQNKRRKK